MTQAPSPAQSVEFTLTGHAGDLAGRRWSGPSDPSYPSHPSYLVVLVHGYGEHLGRYEYVAARLVADGAVVYGIDHVGHGRSEGERVAIADMERLVDDLHLVHERAVAEHPGLPVVLVGHSMGGMLGARYAQRYGDRLAAVVLSAPVLGRWDALDALLAAPEIPDVPIDVATLSRDEAVGAAYQADPLVWHGPFKRGTLEALRDGLATITAAGPLTSCPVLWLHGEDDGLVPREGTASGWHGFGERGESRSYPQARHEIFNEINKDEVLDDVIAFLHRQLDHRDTGLG